jgi:3'(2'), 5'-bisphosphate nucleotidase
MMEVIDIARKAGEKILSYYQQQNMEVAHKQDNSPVTLADKSAHDYIVNALHQLDNTIPILSEESVDVPWLLRKTWTRYWLCDPLDGTREFISGKPEFTVNIALIEQHQPIMGVIYAPALDTVYYATKNKGAYRQVANGTPELLHMNPIKKSATIRVIGSHSKSDEQGELFLQQLGSHTWHAMGSALKFCKVAEGSYDIYPRFLPCMEWDTAAGQCIVEAAGGVVVTPNGLPLAYNQKESLKNPSFIARKVEEI